ncbi:MAG: ribose-phosphate pyrophosphokinase [Oscillospiraceae bacterium]|jgi:ribose-phosphate pyrophosphokinase|nr:ribose-phosphate pyrophosphokinase [Oscillospiraceae bacterium]
MGHGREIKVFSGNANKPLAEAICHALGTRLGLSDVGAFADGETSVSLHETVRGLDVFIIQPTCTPVNKHLMELLVMIDACKRASAGRITAVIPYFGYARQDRKTRARDPISAKLVANLITVAGADRVLTMDLHASQIQGFFDIPVDNLLGAPLFAEYYMRKFDLDPGDAIVVSPDVGSITRARAFAQKLGLGLATIDKRREEANRSEVMNIIGEVRGKTVVMIDDMLDTAGSICGAAAALMEFGGAKDIYACASHGLLSGPAVGRIESSCIKELRFLDTIPYPAQTPCDRIKYIESAPLFAEAIKRIYEEVSISTLFR